MATSRHRDTDDENTEEIPVVPHHKCGTVVNEKGERVMDPTSWRPCDCRIGADHT